MTTLMDRFRLDGKVAVVTGAGRGIGAACATTFAEAGADVVISARTAEQLDDVKRQIEALGRRAVAIPADLNDTDNLPTLVEQAVDAFGRLDVVVNNVGGTMPRPFPDTTPGFLERAFHFNVTTAYVLTQAATPHLLERNGSIVNISSAISRLPDRGFAAYGTAKAALSHLTRLLAADLAPKVRVNAIAVGSVATSALEIVTSDEAMRASMVAAVPLKRLGEPEDISLAALYLASPAASWVTGKVFEIDGGLNAANLSLGIPDL